MNSTGITSQAQARQNVRQKCPKLIPELLSLHIVAVLTEAWLHNVPNASDSQQSLLVLLIGLNCGLQAADKGVK